MLRKTKIAVEFFSQKVCKYDESMGINMMKIWGKS